MRLKYQFIIYVVFLHILILYFAFDYFISQKFWFIGVEILLVASLYIAFRIYRNFIRPLNLISTGIESIKDKDFSLKYLKVGNKDLNSLIEVFNRMMEELREERRKQQEQNYFLEKLTQASPVGVVVLDACNKIKDINPAAEKILLLSRNLALGKSFQEVNSPFSKEIISLQDDETITLKNNGIESYRLNKSHFMDKGFQNHFIIIEELTNEVLTIEKNAYGKVIRMMSHEVNNTVGSINSLLNSLKVYQDQLKDDDRYDFENALDVTIARNNNINRFMNNFADVIRLPEPTKEEVEVNGFIENVKKLMSPFCEKNNIVIRTVPSKTKYPMKFDPLQMEQLFVNVIKNSSEAISGQGEIIITIDDENNEIRLEDTGKGLTPEEEKMLFTPFFSSKKSGQGIGLTICREIAINHGFGIQLNNREKEGTVFICRLKP